MGDLAGSLAGRAGFSLRAGFYGRSFAGSAGLRAFDINFHLLAHGRIHEGDGQVVAEVRPFSRPGRPAAARAESEEILEDIAEAGEDVFEPGKAGESGPAEAFVSVPVIKLTLLRVPEDLVSFRRLFEFFLRGFIPRVPVRMILESQLAVSFFDIRLIGAAGHAQDFVIIFLHHVRKCFLLQNINILGMNVKLDRQEREFEGLFLSRKK
jgi:hypothetical protein